MGLAEMATEEEMRRAEKVAELGGILKGVTLQVGELREASKDTLNSVRKLEKLHQGVSFEKEAYDGFKRDVTTRFDRVDSEIKLLKEDLHRRRGVRGFLGELGVVWPVIAGIGLLATLAYYSITGKDT